MRRFVRIAVASLLVLVAGEVALRTSVASSVLGPPRLYYQVGVDERIAALDATLAAHGDVDVLFVGSSVVRTNVAPLVFDDAVAGDRPTVSFNAGLSGLGPDAVRLYLEHLWLTEAEPDLIVVGVRHDELAHAQPAEQIERLRLGAHERIWLEPSTWADLKGLLVNQSRIAAYAGSLTRLATSSPRFEPPVIDGRGHGPAIAATTGAEPGPVDGGSSERRRSTDPARFALGVRALGRIVDVAEAAGAEVVIVTLPEHPAKFADATGPDRYEQYLTALERFGQARGVPILDPTHGATDSWPPDAFFDGHHMHADAAAEFTRQLAEILLEADPAHRPEIG